MLLLVWSALGFQSSAAIAQTNEWVWMGGSNSIPAVCPSGQVGCGEAGWYGTLRVPSASNIPGARGSASTWTDSHGNFWLFGGLGYDSAGNLGYLNDLWEFRPATGEWTWVSGGKTVSCIGLIACNLAGECCGVKGVYGTLGTPSPNNTPGSRSSAATWMDSNGNVWLFAGFGFDSTGTLGYLNDVWKFDLATGEWTWMGGSNVISCLYCGQSGQYGTLGTAAPTNIPGGRTVPTKWTDNSGNIWIFGGLGYDSRGIQCYLNDLWEFNPSKNEWTWMGGSEFASNAEAGWPGVYGTLGVPAKGNIPWSLVSPASWTGKDGNLWLFGGIGEDTDSTGYYLNDMWEFYPSLNEWAWISANSVSAGGSWIGIYGTMGDFAPANIPGERNNSATWTDDNGNFWLLGGIGVENPEQSGWLNDLWEFNPSTNEWRWMSGSSSVPYGNYGVAGQYGMLGIPAAGNTPGGRYNAAAWRDSSGNLWLFGGGAFDTHGRQGTLNDLWEYTLAGTPIVQPPIPTAPPTFSLAAGAYTSAQTLTISDQPSGSTIHYTTNGTAPNADSPIYSAPILVSNTETIQAVGVASGHAVSSIASAAYIFSLPATFTLKTSPASLAVVSGGNGTVTLTVTPQNGFDSSVSFACSNLPAGATCSFSPATVTPSQGAVTAQLTLSARAQSAASRSASNPLLPVTALAATLCLFGWRKRGNTPLLLMAVIGLVGLGLTFGCGGSGSGTGSSGGGSSPPPVSVTTSVTVTASSGNIQQRVPILLTVN